jgi:hypothetical protein
MRYTEDELKAMALPYYKVTSVIYGCTDGHFFYAEYEAKTHSEKNRVEYFKIQKPTIKKAEK